MFKLAERRAATGGVYCGEDGVWLGPAELVARRAVGGYRVRPAAEIEALLAAGYPVPPDATGCVAGLRRVASYLSEGNLPLAMIAAVQLRLGEIAEERIERLTRADTLLKAGFNPDEPRDAHGRWSESISYDFILDDPRNEGNAGGSGGILSPSCAGGNGLAFPRAREHYPNTDFRNRLAIAERTAEHKNYGYGEVNNANDPNLFALGRYQMTRIGLEAAGMMDGAGKWTGKYRVHSRAEFLADPEAQEKALTDYLNDNIRQLQAKGAFTHIGETIDGLKARFPVTRAGIIAAAHREGANATRDYLNRIGENGLTSKGLRLSKPELAIETRLRTFSATIYE